MKKIGLVGGMGPESTLDYYKQITRKYEQKKPRSFPPLVMDSLDVFEILKDEENGERDLLVQKLNHSVQNLQAAGADFAVLTANTPHIVFDELQNVSSLPLISILDSTARAIQASKQKRVLLLGTGVTMTKSFFVDKLREYSIEVVVPNAAEIERISSIIADELELGIVNPDSKQYLIAVIENYRSSGVQGVILGCTELPLAISASDVSVKVYDTVKIHVDEILKYAMGE
ncbi:aspartate racemase [Lentilactobacillus curieae]|uniref:Aspartate racemase n=1 Tax=Lentilactobacillus curieae TaxID=1138822 RepID=A0A1S6QI81_9LACO|nr:amino acid racemase [Lentilactobacillus curieae]AQW21299.1 aspartate racemase [Lentilactobacillus curieae]